MKFVLIEKVSIIIDLTVDFKLRVSEVVLEISQLRSRPWLVVKVAIN